MEALSGGEAARLLLCQAPSRSSRTSSLLDEPTNHLDIESIEGLLDGLRLFKGTVVTVSHDRHFVAELSNGVIELVPGEGGTGEERCKAATVSDYGGTYEEYLGRAGRDYMRKQARVSASRSLPC